MVQFAFAEIAPKIRYKLLTATVVPRPIAWVSTIDPSGQFNVAPFSFFNVFGEAPPTIAFSIEHRSRADRKDTGRNIADAKEFVVNLVSDDTLDQMNVTAIDFGPEVDEFAQAQLTPVKSILVKPPRIGESRVAMECRLMQTVELSELRSLILGEVVMMHVSDEAVIDQERGWVDTAALRIIGRGPPGTYMKTTDLISLAPISPSDWPHRSKTQLSANDAS